ncbi:hypothetical protein Acr_18g0011580 [Actinidia rufa]|uniref:Uncharacterized protein n=1 Tax=Actinidia rufa TaxID=165716 RepID=A0A7J0G8G1_9ERIC|nr:hypothetical protein Acr_18g0011580 [Actinidia rufa]
MQELLRNYHKDELPIRCAIKVDLDALEDFHALFSVSTKSTESEIFFAGVTNDDKAILKSILPIPEGALPMKVVWLSAANGMYTTKSAWNAINATGRECRNARPWNAELEWVIQHYDGSLFKHIVYKTTLAATIYHLWREKNARVFSQQAKRPSYLAPED